jgi:hypothetical protein
MNTSGTAPKSAVPHVILAEKAPLCDKSNKKETRFPSKRRKSQQILEKPLKVFGTAENRFTEFPL